MFVDRKTGKWAHRKFTDLLEYLQPGDVMVMNNADADLVPLESPEGIRMVPALPPYIKRKKIEDFTKEDFERYRTVYASVPGSKAAPTAGFHFTKEILGKIKSLGVSLCFVTLHVSYDTYKPIRSENINDHTMHGEKFHVPDSTIESVLKAKQEGRRVIAVGTTAVRTLESLEIDDFRPHSPHISGQTHLFIQPGYSFKIVDALLTNFHRPRSTVLVMVSAFAGRELILSAYEEAIREKYRLFSYGDCMLIV